MTYHKTAKNNSVTGYWEICKATELSAAKREASKTCGTYADDVICVGVALDDEATAFDTIAEKRNGKWIDVA